MGWEALFCLVVIALIFIGLIINVSTDALLLGAVVLVALAGIISPEQALAGFSNSGMLTVGALYVVAAALRETGAIHAVGSWVLGRAKSERAMMMRMAGTLPAMSAFLNNTPIVAMFIPIVSDWCKKHQLSPSRLLLPLSYLCILGGTCTLIGTSTNLVINGLMLEISKSNTELSQTLHPIGFFELGYVGLPYAIIGIVFLLLIGRRLLPSHKSPIEQLMGSVREYLVNMQVQPNCRLIGQSIQQAGLRHLPGLFVVELDRAGQVTSPVSPDQILETGDILTFTGAVSSLVDLENVPGLVPVADNGYVTQATKRRGGILCEAVVSPGCPSIGKTIRDADFRALYNAAVIAVHRGKERLTGKVGDIVLRAGDTLLLQAGTHFVRAQRNNSHFLLVSNIEGSRPLRHDRAVYSLILVVALIGLMVSGLVPIVLAAFLVAGLMVLTRCISTAQARQSIDWRILITIGSALGLAKALDVSGLAGSAANFLVEVAGNWGAHGTLAALYLITSIFAAVVGNNAAAVMIFPFSLGIGQQLGLSPRPFVMAVVFAASASFVSPLSYQTNLMVYGPGGYRFTDFLRVGLPLTLLLLACATLLIPCVWPFQ